MPPGDIAAVLQCRGLRKRFGELEAVAGIDLQVAEGETYGPELAILLGYAAVLLALATWRLHAALTR